MNLKTIIIAAACSATLFSCSRPAEMPYANDTTLSARQPEAVGKMPRVIVLTDAETDDRCSMVHFLHYANSMQVDAIIQTNSCYQKKGWSSQPWLEEQLDAYAKIYPNLKVHDPNYPTPEYLKSVVFVGDENPDHIGTGFYAAGYIPGMEPANDPTGWEDTPGSDRIVEVLLEDDPRPVYIQAWGGGNTALRAFDKIKEQYPSEYDRAMKKAILYCIWYQDAAGNNIERRHPGVTILLNHHFSGSWDYGTMINSDDYVSKYIKNGKNPLGQFYTQPYISEGDSPAFLYSVKNGLRSYEDPSFGGWGGRFYKVDGFDNVYRDTGFGELREWLEPAMHDFQARLAWGMTPEFEKGNHHPQISFPEGQDRTVHPGDTVSLKIAVVDNDKTDPEAIWKLRGSVMAQQGMTYEKFMENQKNSQSKQSVTTNWYHYLGGTYQGKVDLIFSREGVKFVAPKVTRPETIHIVAEAVDNGFPSLTSYARFIITVEPSK